jgi:hypothetical protein
MTILEAGFGLVWAVVGALAAVALSLVPALHIYNVAGFLILSTSAIGPLLAPQDLAMLLLGLVTGYSILNTIPSIFLSAPDDSTVFVVLPGQKYLDLWTQKTTTFRAEYPSGGLLYLRDHRSTSIPRRIALPVRAVKGFQQIQHAEKRQDHRIISLTAVRYGPKPSPESRYSSQSCASLNRERSGYFVRHTRSSMWIVITVLYARVRNDHG